MLDEPLKAYLLFDVEPDGDFADSAKTASVLSEAEWVVAMTPFESQSLKECADVLLPIGTFAETSGTYVNAEGRWQSFEGIANPVGEARPGWKLLRVLGNLLEVPGFDYTSSEEIRDEVQERAGEFTGDNKYTGAHKINGSAADGVVWDVPIYRIDSLVRRATSLQKTADGRAVAKKY